MSKKLKNKQHEPDIQKQTAMTNNSEAKSMRLDFKNQKQEQEIPKDKQEPDIPKPKQRQHIGKQKPMSKH